MQANPAFAKASMLETISRTVRGEGVLALWKGMLPPFCGSLLYRSVQFSAYGFIFGSLRDVPMMRQEVGGTELRVLAGGVASGFARFVVECPLEYMKTQKQIIEGTSYRNLSLRAMYTGALPTLARNCTMMTVFFGLMDQMTRRFPALVEGQVSGPFIKGGVCSTLAWWVAWPLDNLKSQVQAARSSAAPLSMMALARQSLQRGGMTNLYRGLLPGSLRSCIGNGASMIAYNMCQQARLKYEASS